MAHPVTRDKAKASTEVHGLVASCSENTLVHNCAVRIRTKCCVCTIQVLCAETCAICALNDNFAAIKDVKVVVGGAEHIQCLS